MKTKNEKAWTCRYDIYSGWTVYGLFGRCFYGLDRWAARAICYEGNLHEVKRHEAKRKGKKGVSK